MSNKGVNLSETFKLTKNQCSFSPDGRFIANASQFRLVIREFETLQIITVFTCIDTVDKVLWSPNSKMILTSCFKRNASQLWAIENPTWKCKLDEGSSGLADCLWCPDSKQVLTWSEFGVRINVWSLDKKGVRHIQYPKLNSGGCKFNKIKVVVCERRERDDYISVFNYRTWDLLCNFKLATEDVATIEIVNNSILACDTSLNPCYFAYSFDGNCLSKVKLYSNMLGIKHVTKSVSEQFAAIGCYDGTCKLINSVTWSILKVWKHNTMDILPDTVCYQEVNNGVGSRYDIVTSDRFNIPLVKANYDDPYLLVGIGLAAFSGSGRYFATRCDSAPTIVWIWDMENTQLCSVINNLSPVVAFEWDPVYNKDTDENLAICCNNDHVYVWNVTGVLAIKVPNCYTLNGAGELGPVRNFGWSCKGNCLILKGDYHFCLCYFPTYES